MNSKNQKGFTVIEVMLFLALSAAFLGIAFIGINGRTSALQFTDSMRSLHNYLLSEQNKVMNGVNSGQNSACDAANPTGTNEDCILVGRIVTFTNDSTIVGSDIIHGDKPSTDSLINLSTDVDKIKLSNPQSNGSPEGYEVSWDTKFNAAESTGLGATQASGLGWLRSPDSSIIVPIVVNDSVSFNPINLASAELQLDDISDTRLCFTGVNGQVASINYNKSSIITLEFDDVDCE